MFMSARVCEINVKEELFLELITHSLFVSSHHVIREEPCKLKDICVWRKIIQSWYTYIDW